MNPNEETIYQAPKSQDGIDNPVMIIDEAVTMFDGDRTDMEELTMADETDDLYDAIELTYDTPDPMDGIDIASLNPDNSSGDDFSMV